MISAKENIIQQAKTLFNEKGYYQVTMRDIAKAAGTTLGNLTYHFHRKEDLVLEIQKDANNNILYALEKHLREESHLYTLTELIETFVATEQNQKEFNYYFNNLMELGRDYPSIRERQQYIRGVFFKYYYMAFLSLQAANVFRKDLSEEQFHSLARTIVFLMTIWNQSGSPTYEDPLETHSYLQTCSDLIYAFLSDNGQENYHEFFATFSPSNALPSLQL